MYKYHKLERCILHISSPSFQKLQNVGKGEDGKEKETKNTAPLNLLGFI